MDPHCGQCVNTPLSVIFLKENFVNLGCYSQGYAPFSPARQIVQ